MPKLLKLSASVRPDEIQSYSSPTFMNSALHAFTITLGATLIASPTLSQEVNVPSGEWRGQVQWYATVDAKPDPTAHSINTVVIAVDSRGKVVLSASDMGCTGLGLFSAGPMPVIKTLDITFKGCSYEGYNRRFGGTLLLEDGGRRVKLKLQTSNIRIGTKTAFYEVTGALVR